MTISSKEKAKYLAKYYANATDARATQISAFIKEIERLKLNFPNMTKLSDYIAIRLAEAEGSPVSGSTIRRNEKYKSLLIEHLLRVSPEKVNTKVDKNIQASLHARYLRIELQQKNQQIATLQERLNETETLLSKRLALEYAENMATNRPRIEEIRTSNEETDESLFEVLYSALLEIGNIEFNADKGNVYDEAEQRVLMTRVKFPKFFKWLATKV